MSKELNWEPLNSTLFPWLMTVHEVTPFVFDLVSEWTENIVQDTLLYIVDIIDIELQVNVE